ncbi:hypothetical protein G7054_g11004 [Neopestalotiopsis clavispora]|nr:hypothetical protein G7054_g11004 [Neopestalotiopsis clavispora]
MEADEYGEEYCNEVYPNPGQHTYWYTRTLNGAAAVITETVSTTTTTRTRTAVVTTTRTRLNVLTPPINKRATFNGFIAQGETVIRQVCKCMAQRKRPYTFTHTRTIGAAGVTRTVRVIATSTATTTTTSTVTTTRFLGGPGPVITPTTTTTTTPTPTPTPKPPAVVRPGAAQCDFSNIPGGKGAGGCQPECFCDIDADGVNAYCDIALASDGLTQCTSDAQCGPTQACMDFLGDGNTKCYTINTCTSTFVPPVILQRNEDTL